jgi:hypothetical protein
VFILNDDAMDSVSGTFAGKPEGTAFTSNFLGSGFVAATTYTDPGSSRNDVAVIVGFTISSLTVTPGTTINENDTVTVDGAVFPKPAGTSTVTISWGDGTPDTTLNLPAGETTFSSMHQYLDDNPTGTPSDVYTITVTVTDDTSGDSDTQMIVETVNNVPPVLDDGKVNFTTTPFASVDRAPPGQPAHTLSNWVVGGGGTSVQETRRSVPSVYLAPAGISTQTMRGLVTVSPLAGEVGGDFFGLVLGFDSNDFTDSGADYLLLDWKQTTESVSNVQAKAGLALSRVTGAPANHLELWSHTGVVTELARGATLGNIGWTHGTSYDVIVDYTPTRVIVIVDGVLQMDVLGSFSSGAIGFYAYSQKRVNFSNWVDDSPIAHDNIPISFTKSFTDPGSLDTFTATINWGDGSPTESCTLAAPTATCVIAFPSPANPVGTITGTHTYAIANLGDNTVTVTITDDDTRTSTDTFKINVQDPPPPPTILGFAGGAASGSRTIEWTASEGAVHYELKVDNLTTGEGDIVRVNGIMATSYELATSLTDGIYRAMVRGYSDHGDAGGWSLGHDFTIGSTSTTSSTTTRFYRAYNPNADFHFFTTSSAEFANALAHGYRDETTDRPGFKVESTSDSGAKPIFRLYNLALGYHYYTSNVTERDYLVNLVPPPPTGQPDKRTTGWRYGKDEGFIYRTLVSGSTEIFRLYNRNTGVHLFTESAGTKDAILSLYPGVWVQHASFGFAFAVGPDGNGVPRSAGLHRDRGSASPIVAPATALNSVPESVQQLPALFAASLETSRPA